MKKIKVTQHQAIFYQLYEARKINPEGYVPIWKLIGEVYVPAVGVWAYVSYEVSARMSELWSKNPNLFERKQVEGKSGSKYFAYRLRIGCAPDDIKDLDLKAFHSKIYFYSKQSI
jgi:hypothetical protein